MKRTLSFLTVALVLTTAAMVDPPPGQPSTGMANYSVDSYMPPAPTLEGLSAAVSTNEADFSVLLGFDPGYRTTVYAVPEPPDIPAQLLGVAEKLDPNPMPDDAIFYLSSNFSRSGIRFGDGLYANGSFAAAGMTTTNAEVYASTAGTRSLVSTVANMTLTNSGDSRGAVNGTSRHDELWDHLVSFGREEVAAPDWGWTPGRYA